MNSPRFVHLHTHSHYSLLSALPKIPELVKAAKEDGMSALALTDSGNLYGAIDFYKACQKNGVKPIIGVDFYVATATRHDKRAGIDNKRTRLVLLAKDNEGYKNLVRLVTASHLEGFYYKPRIDRELIAKHAEGLVAILPQFSGEIAQALKSHDSDRAEESLAFFRSVYPDLYIEITHHPEIPEQMELRNTLVAFAQEKHIPLVAAQDVYYMRPEDHRIREIVIAIQNGSPVDKDSSWNESDENFSFISQETAVQAFADVPEALENTIRISEMCNIELELGNWVFPDFPIPDNTTYDAELRRVAHEGIEARGLTHTPELEHRLEYELDVIKTKGYSPYFLVVSDLLTFAKEHGILTNTRGSAAGSLVAYLTFITSVDPLAYNLPFERFLNPKRPSPPDIDMDFADNRRDDVIAYAREKYGQDRVAQIGTFGTMLARGSVRDVARALGYPYGIGDQIAKLIPQGSQGFPMTIERALEEEADLKKLYEQSSEAKEIIDTARKIEGNARHISVHAAGVVIAPTDMSDYTPVQMDPKGGKIITQYDMHAVEDAGLLKFDFLGITNLAMLEHSVRLVKQLRDIDVNLDTLPLDDKKTYAMLWRGETLGLFQLGGGGMTRSLMDLKPTSIHDINAMVALYRPGPMAFIPEYIRRKRDPSLVSYLDPRMKPILERSYGIITYQDDVLMIAIDLAGYDWTEADKFRKAIGKKIPEEMAKQKKRFFEGCIDGGMAPGTVETLWEQIETFAAYGFNKAHAASYGNLAYKTAYMKANFPAEYMTAVLSAESGDVARVAEVIGECKRMGIPVLPPSVNESFGDFTVVRRDGDADNIRFGLYSVKNLGTDIADAIIAERKKNDTFTKYGNFLERIEHKNLNKKSLEALAKSGALDDLGDRSAIVSGLDDALTYHKEHLSADKTQDSIFSLIETATSGFTLKPAALLPEHDLLAWEKELLGLYVSGHPLEKHRTRFEKNGMHIPRMKEDARDEMRTVIAGIIEDIRIVRTKKGDTMAFVKLADFYDSMEIVFFPKTYESYKHLLNPDACIVVQGKFSTRNNEVSVIADSARFLEEKTTA
ncbi:MAG: DNA polymerase III subunit alpha [Candidatus Yonathbacteria bacterium]|nr:DNA polymerase III subunit alpha [Candidatus Yonathbacteria bacterium]NTW47772.1 DNA polymerase III subunit alpha [Candidatus Yonathbacteria bacterium]